MGKRVFIAVVAAFLAGCGGSSPTAVLQPPAVATTSVATAAGATTTIVLPKIRNFITGSVTLPATNVATTGSLTYEASIPAGIAAPQSNARGLQSIGGTSLATLGVLVLTVSPTVVISSTPAFTFTTPSVVSGSTYIAFYDANDPANGWNILQGPGTASGTTITFAAKPLLPPITLVAGDTYFFALVSSSTAITATSTASYSGTKSVSYQYGYDFAYPAPAPTATEAPTTLNYTVATSVSVGSQPFPGPSPSVSGLVDEHVAETDTQSVQTSTFTTDSWAAESLASGVESLSLYALVQQEPSSADLPVYTTVYATPQLLDQYPETGGATWTNSPAAAITYGFADGDSGTRTVAANGTYVDTESVLGTPATLTENADGSGSIIGPFFSGDFIASIAFSAPTNGQVTTTINYTPDAQNYYGYPPSQVIGEPVWYPVPPVFSTETDTVTANVSLPTGCTTTFGTTATQVQRSITTLDTVIGDIETTVMNGYEIGGIPVCLASTDVVNYAYDEQNNTPYLIYIGQLGTEVVTTTEVLSVQPGATSALPAAKSRSTLSTTPGTPSALPLAALENHVLASFVKARIVHEHAYVAGMRARPATSLKAKAVSGGAR